MTQSDYITDPKKIVGEILRKVDQLIRAGNIDESIREIILAREIDPKHGYIRAYEERLAYLKQEHEKSIEREQTRKAAEDAARKRDEQLRKQHEEEGRRLKEEQKRKEDERKREEARIKTNPERAQIPKIEQPELGPRIVKAVRDDSPNASKNDRPSLPSLAKSRSTAILVVEDDKDMLQMISQTLVSAGYETTSLTTSDEAYVLLKKWVPSLILCDVNLETSTMGGFAFYEKIRALDHLVDVPFVFLTGLNDEVLLRTAKELGADDYLFKPISVEHLLSTIKGKLKRFGTFQKKS